MSDYSHTRPEALLPDIKGLETLASFFIEIGQATPVQGGLIPITWAEIQAWNEATKSKCEPWELKAIRVMSEAYCSGHALGRKPTSVAPWADISKKDIKKDLKSFFTSMVEAQTVRDKRKKNKNGD